MASTDSLSVSYNIGNSPDPATAYAAIFKGGSKTMSPDKIDAAASDFESMFVSQMLEQMFGESEGDEAFGSEETNDVYKGLLMEQYGKLIARSGGIGIATFVKQELLKQQEIAK